MLLFSIGHYGTGKTLLGVEAVKIKAAQSLERGEEVEVYILPFTEHPELSNRFKTNLFVGVQNVRFFDCLEDFIKKYIDPDKVKYKKDLRGNLAHEEDFLKLIGEAKKGE